MAITSTPEPLDYGAALSRLLGALDQNVGVGLHFGGHLVANFDGTLTQGFDAAAVGMPITPFDHRDAVTLQVGQVGLSLRPDRFTAAEWVELNGGAGQQLSMRYGDLTFTLRWAYSPT
ncbi:MAG: hypothetical protein WCB04_13055 [Mycobacteriales bacterium]